MDVMQPAGRKLTVRASNFLRIGLAEWEIPAGVSVLVGPACSGKSHLLRVPAILGDLILWRGRGCAVGLPGLCPSDGEDSVAQWGADEDSPVCLAVQWDDVRVDFELPHRPEDWPHAIERAAEPQRKHALAAVPILSAVYHADHDIRAARRLPTGSRPANTAPSLCGENLWWTLYRWRESFGGRLQHVVNGMRDAFGEAFDDLHFEHIGPRPDAPLNVTVRGADVWQFSNGWFEALMHLAAVTAAEVGSVVSLDDFGCFMSPQVTRSVLISIAEIAKANDLRVILGTHSPTVLDAFNSVRDNVFVMVPTAAKVPSRLSDRPELAPLYLSRPGAW